MSPVRYPVLITYVKITLISCEVRKNRTCEYVCEFNL